MCYIMEIQLKTLSIIVAAQQGKVMIGQVRLCYITYSIVHYNTGYKHYFYSKIN